MTDARAQFVDVEVLQARRPQTMPQTRWPVQSVHVVGCELSKSIQGRCVSTLETHTATFTVRCGGCAHDR